MGKKAEDWWGFLWRELCSMSTRLHTPQPQWRRENCLFPSILLRGLQLTTTSTCSGCPTFRDKVSWWLIPEKSQLSKAASRDLLNTVVLKTNSTGTGYSSKLFVSCGPVGCTWEGWRGCLVPCVKGLPEGAERPKKDSRGVPNCVAGRLRKKS